MRWAGTRGGVVASGLNNCSFASVIVMAYSGQSEGLKGYGMRRIWSNTVHGWMRLALGGVGAISLLRRGGRGIMAAATGERASAARTLELPTCNMSDYG
jgi:hypothetical protein